MGSFGRDNRGVRGGDRGGFSPRGRSFGGARGFDRPQRGGDREMFKATCSNCGKECEVPFRPTNGKPVYCSDCFEKMGGRRNDSSRNDFQRAERPEFRPQVQSSGISSAQIDTLNSKLDKIISLLEPKKVEAVMPDLIIEEKVKPEKVKKVSKKASKKE